MQAFRTEKQRDVGQAEDRAKILQVVSWLQDTLHYLLILNTFISLADAELQTNGQEMWC